MNYYFLLTVLIVCLTGCSAQPISTEDVVGPESWGASNNVTQVGHIYFSEQPDRTALQIAKTNGISTVINLREPGESDWDEQVVAEQLGLNYSNIPIRKQSNTLDPSAIAAINAAVEANHGEPVLLHCSSGNRAAAWFAIYLVEKHHLSTDEALSVAQEVGLTKTDTMNRVRTYLSREAEDER